MKVLYIGQLWPGGTCIARMNTLETLGISATPFDVTPYIGIGSRVEQSVQSRLNIGRGIAALNRKLRSTSQQVGYDAVWVDKGVWLYPETLTALKAASRKSFAVHYTPDPQITYHRSRHFFACIPSYDLIVTTKPYELAGYEQFGAREIVLVLQGYSPQFTPGSASDQVRAMLHSEVCFVGRYERHYAGRVRAAMTCGGKLAVWGPRWPRYALFRQSFRSIVRGNGVWGVQYPQALSSTKIALGLLSKLIPETTTTRTFEIPATSTFMLAERTDDHLDLFEEGKEAEFFGCDDELREKIRFYLANDGARERIAKAGRERSLRSGYSDEHQLRRVLTRIGELLGGSHEVFAS